MTLYCISNDATLPFAFVAFSFLLGLAYVIIPVECAFLIAYWFDVTLKGPIIHAELSYVYAILIFCFRMFYNHLYVSGLQSISAFQNLFLFNFEQEELKSFCFSSKPLFMDV